MTWSSVHRSTTSVEWAELSTSTSAVLGLVNCHSHYTVGHVTDGGSASYPPLYRLSLIKPVADLARVLPSFKWPLLSVHVMVGMYDSVERYPVYNPAISRRRCALAYFTLHAAMQRMAIAYVMKVTWKCRNFVGVRSCQMFLLPEFSSEWADYNTMFYECVLKGSTRTYSWSGY